MKQIVANIQIFTPHQPVFVYEDGNKIAAARSTVDTVPDTILKFLDQYPDISEIVLHGPRSYTAQARRRILQAAAARELPPIVIKA